MAHYDDPTRTEDLGTYEMLWDCPYCGHKKLLALTHRHCPNCGAAQGDPALRYFPPDEEAVPVKEHEYYGADLVCSRCKAPQSRNANNCGNCGASLEGQKDAGMRGVQVVADGAAFEADSTAAAKRERQAAKDAARGIQPAAPPPKKGGWLWKAALIGLAVITVLWLVFRKHEAGVVITGHTWEREVQIDRKGPQPGSAWCDQLPFGAYSVSRSREQRSTKEVPDGEECVMKRVDKGNGTFKKERECKPKYRSEPVYDDKCRYLVNAWGRARSEKAAGGSLAEAPRWPEVRLARTGDCLGCEREAGRSETYKLLFKDEKDQKSGDCTVDESRWRGAADGSRWSIRVGMSGADCSSMTPAK